MLRTYVPAFPEIIDKFAIYPSQKIVLLYIRNAIVLLCTVCIIPGELTTDLSTDHIAVVSLEVQNLTVRSILFVCRNLLAETITGGPLKAKRKED